MLWQKHQKASLRLHIKKNCGMLQIKLRAQSSLKTNEFSTPVLGLIFLKYADYRFADAIKKLPPQSGRSAVSLKDRVQELGVLFMPEQARYDYLLSRPESENIAKAVNEQ